jgi:hypothetical protein
MFGKYTQQIQSSLDNKSLKNTIKTWAEENELRKLKESNGIELYRFGSPLLSNPIYIQLEFVDGHVNLTGWVQTLIPFLRWKLVPVPKEGIGTTLDYRKKGGSFCEKLQRLIA